MQPKELFRIQKSNLEVIVGQLSTFGGRNSIDVRSHLNLNGQGYTPTKKGVSIPIEHIDALVAGIQAIKAELEAQGVK